MTAAIVTDEAALHGFAPAEGVEPPAIAASSGARLVGFRPLRGPGGAVFASGCVATSIPGWVDDMRAPIEARTVALVGAASERLRGAPIDVGTDELDRPAPTAHVLARAHVLRLASRLEEPPIGSARSFVGFDDGAVLTCFATCVAEDPALCSGATRASRLVGSTPAPAPGVALRGVDWAVHHPRDTAVGGGLTIVALGILAVITRRKTRSRRFL